MRCIVWISGLLFIITLVVYSPVRNFEFVNFDDPDHVQRNDVVKHGLSWRAVRESFSKNLVGNWIPLTCLSHVLDYRLFGLNPRGHHAVNVLFHAANAVLIFVIFASLTGALWRAALIAALFAWHPMHVESVAWISERKDVLSTFFLLLTIGAYVRYVTKRQTAFYVLALGCFVAGLLSKPMLVTLPFVLLLLDMWPLERFSLWPVQVRESFSKLLAEKIPFLLFAVVVCVVTYRFQQAQGTMAKENGPLIDRLATAIIACQHYLQKLFWPKNLTVLYSHPLSWPWWNQFGAVVLLIAITVFIVVGSRSPVGVFGWLWFLGTLVPVLGIIQVGSQYMADRYTYIPSIGLFSAIIWGGHELFCRLRFGLVFQTVVATLILAFSVTATERQLPYWKNSISLFEHALAVTPHDGTAHFGLAEALLEQGRMEDAIIQYRETLRRMPEHLQAHGKIALALASLGRVSEAIVDYEAELQIDPSSSEAMNNLAWIFATDKDPRLRDGLRSIQLAQRACDVTGHKNPMLIGTLAAAYAEAGQFPKAVQTAQQASALAAALGDRDLAAKNLQLMEVYRQNRAFHTP